MQQAVIPRTLLVAGTSGAGSTTVAAALAVRSARTGHKTLLLSLDPPARLDHVVGRSLEDAAWTAHARAHSGSNDSAPPEPIEVEAGLYCVSLAADSHQWPGIRDLLTGLLDDAGVDPADLDELLRATPVAGIQRLLALRGQLSDSRWDSVVVDLGRAGAATRLLGLPERLLGYLDRALPVARRVERAVRAGADGGPDPLLTALPHLSAELGALHTLLDSPRVETYLVLTPQRSAVQAARRHTLALALLGHRLTALVVNQLVPDGHDPWRRATAAAQRQVLDDVYAHLARGADQVLLGPHTGGEPMGSEALAVLAEALCGPERSADPRRPASMPSESDGQHEQRDHDQPHLHRGRGPRVHRGHDAYEVHLDLPLARREEIDLGRRGDDLVFTVGSSQRIWRLPSALRRCRIVGARLSDGVLIVRLTPDPALWGGQPW